CAVRRLAAFASQAPPPTATYTLSLHDALPISYGGIFEKGLLEEITNTAKIIAFKEGDALINIGQYIKSMPLLIDGVIKIMREDFDAGELLLYFLEKGDTCSMTLSCCIGEKKSEIKAIAETDGLVAMLPIQKTEEWLS